MSYKLLNPVFLLLMLTAVALPFLCDASSNGVNLVKHEIIKLKSDSLNYQLCCKKIITNSESVTSDGLILERGKDYEIDYDSGIITFFKGEYIYHTIIITYYIYPDYLTERFYQYEMLSIQDTLSSLKYNKKKQFLLNEDSKLIVSGSKTISITFSNQESYDIYQSLYLSINGELSNDLKIEGKLSDSESPLTPEGDSREISNLDQLYLRLYGNKYKIIFGDQDTEFNDTYLMNYKSSFEGISAGYDDNFSVYGALAVNGGKTETNIIQGIEGKQGPYYLTANTNEQLIQVVAGSEVISINGETLNRGNDYSIDYSQGSLTFHRMITSNSRIVAKFQYSDNYYGQNLYMSSSKIVLSPGLSLGHQLISQIDNRNNPLQWSFTASDKDSLRKAGDSDVWGQGVYEVDPGKGLYVIKTDEQNNPYYEYAPNDSTANYLVYFSYVGQGNGSYEPIGTNKYRYFGQGQGSYIPAKKLIAPVSQTNLGLNIKYQKGNLEIMAEGVLTNKDKNTFSSLDDKDNNSYMAYFNTSLNLPINFLEPSLELNFLRKNKKSFSFNDLTSASEYYEFESVPAYDSLTQNQLDLNIRLGRTDIWRQNFSFRIKRIEDAYEQKYLKTDTKFYQRGFIPAFNWYGIYSRTDFSQTDYKNNALFYNILGTAWQKGILKMSTNLLFNRSEYTYNNSDSLSSSAGSQYVKVTPEIELSNENNYKTKMSFIEETNSVKAANDWVNTAKSRTWILNQIVNHTNNTVNLSISHREQNKEDQATTDNQNNNQSSNLIDLKSTHNLFKNSVSAITAYQLTQIEFFPKLKVLEYIGEGLGSYDADSVQVENGDYDYVYINSGNGQLTSDINANLNLFIHLAPEYFPNSFLHKVKLENSFQYSLNTTAKNDVNTYLLIPGDFFSSDSTKYGREYTQHTLWYDIVQNVVTGSVRYKFVRTIDNRYQDLSRTKNLESEAELDWKSIMGIQVRTSYLRTKEEDSKYGSIVKTDLFSTVLNKYLSNSLNTQTTLTYSKEEGNQSVSNSNSYTINIYRINSILSMYFKNKYRTSASLLTQLNKRSGSDFLSFIPNKRNGLVFNWSAQFQYKFNNFTSGVFSYTGKSYPEEQVTHELKMEFSAEL